MNDLTTQTELFDNVAHIIEQARQRVRTAVNTAMVYAYFEIGRHIVEHEQKGDTRAEYGKALLKELSAKLTLTLVRAGATLSSETYANFI